MTGSHWISVGISFTLVTGLSWNRVLILASIMLFSGETSVSETKCFFGWNFELLILQIFGPEKTELLAIAIRSNCTFLRDFLLKLQVL